MSLRIMVDERNEAVEVLDKELVRLDEKINSNNADCAQLKGALQAIFTANTPQDDGLDSSATLTNTSTITNANDGYESDIESVQSISSIHSSDPPSNGSASSGGEQHDGGNISNLPEAEEIPGMKKFLSLLQRGEIKLSTEVMNQLTELNIKVDAVNDVSAQLQEKWSEIDSAIKVCQKEILELKQYIMMDDLLFHNFHLPKNHENMSSLQFSYFMACQINYYLPQLACPVSWQHISDAHPLKTKNNKSQVIIVRFCNRNMRHEIYSNRAFLPSRMSITEHLIPQNLEVTRKAKELFGFRRFYTDRCKTYVNVNGKDVRVKTVDDVKQASRSVNPNYRVNTNYWHRNSNAGQQNNYSDAVRRPPSHKQGHNGYYNNQYNNYNGRGGYGSAKMPPHRNRGSRQEYSVHNR